MTHNHVCIDAKQTITRALDERTHLAPNSTKHVPPITRRSEWALCTHEHNTYPFTRTGSYGVSCVMAQGRHCARHVVTHNHDTKQRIKNALLQTYTAGFPDSTKHVPLEQSSPRMSCAPGANTMYRLTCTGSHWVWLPLLIHVIKQINQY